MKSYLTVILFCISISAFSQSTTEEAVLTLSKKKFDWLVNRQYDSLMGVLDDRVQYIHSNGWVETKQEILDDLRSGKLNYRAVSIKNASVRLFGNSAIVIGQGSFEVVMSDKPLTIELLYTEVYVSSNGKWRLTSRHANRLP